MRHFQAKALAVLSVVVLSAALVVAAAFSLPVDAATKYNPCSLLTTADLEGTLHAKVAGSQDRDQTIDEGPYKGETMSTCDWLLGSGAAYVSLSVINARSPQEQAAGLAIFRAKMEQGRARGWTIEPGNIPGAECLSAKPPASEPNAIPATACFMSSKGLGFGVTVLTKAAVTARAVKTLADKVAARLP